MNRKAFMASFGALFAAPFVKEEEPVNELPKDGITREDVEKFVKEEIRRQHTITVKSLSESLRIRR
jgi:hypothetical protein